MSPPQFKRLTSHAVLLPIDDVDTDQIIPARYLKVTDKQGLEEGLFAGWRYDEDGEPKSDFPLNRPQAEGAEILVSGRNFGCGSSREHAPWALLAEGFRAVLAPSFADIFRSNALKNGLLVAEMDPNVHADLAQQLKANPTSQITIELAEQTITLPDGREVRFPIDSFAKRCLLNGIDSLGYLLQQEDHIRAYEAQHD